MNRTKSVIALLGIAGLASFAPAANAQTVLDTFTVAQSLNNAFGSPVGSTATGAVSGPTTSIFGGTRTTTLVKVAGGGGNSVNIAGGTLVFDNGSGVDGRLILQYAIPSTNITTGANGLTGEFAGDLAGALFGLDVITATGTGTTSRTIVPSGSAGTFSPFSIPFSSLTGTFDLTRVTGVRLQIEGVNSFDGQLRLLRFSTPPSGVPEPGSIALLIGGALSGAVVLRRRRK